MNRAAFYAALRKRDSGVFGTSLTKGQVRGMDAIIDEAEKRGTPLRHLAYILATPYHETGGRMLPVRENLNYSVDGLLKTFGRHRISEADARKYGRTGNRPADQMMLANILYGGEWGAKNLGNTQHGDGWFYRGGGLAQITGRANFTRFGMAADPARSGDLIPSVRMMFDGMERGLFTGKRLSDFTDYRLMRQIINRMDRADDVAKYADTFEGALRVAGYGPGKIAAEARIRDVAFTVPGQADTPPTGKKPGAAAGISIIGIIGAALAYWWATLTGKLCAVPWLAWLISNCGG